MNEVRGGRDAADVGETMVDCERAGRCVFGTRCFLRKGRGELPREVAERQCDWDQVIGPADEGVD